MMVLPLKGNFKMYPLLVTKMKFVEAFLGLFIQYTHDYYKLMYVLMYGWYLKRFSASPFDFPDAAIRKSGASWNITVYYLIRCNDVVYTLKSWNQHSCQSVIL